MSNPTPFPARALRMGDRSLVSLSAALLACLLAEVLPPRADGLRPPGAALHRAGGLRVARVACPPPGEWRPGRSELAGMLAARLGALAAAGAVVSGPQPGHTAGPAPADARYSADQACILAERRVFTMAGGRKVEIRQEMAREHTPAPLAPQSPPMNAQGR